LKITEDFLGAKCDGFKDCADKSDEKPELCGTTIIRAPTTVSTPRRWRKRNLKYNGFFKLIFFRNRTTTTTTPKPTRPPSPGSCIIPDFKNAKIINNLFEDEYFPGDNVEHAESVEIKCDPKYSLLVVNDADTVITCMNGKWDNVFRKCQS
jgi:hypothetical protein